MRGELEGGNLKVPWPVTRRRPDFAPARRFFGSNTNGVRHDLRSRLCHETASERRLLS
jgi:hypothetical protein